MSSGKKTRGTVVCVELGADRFKILQFDTTGGSLRLQRCRVEAMDADDPGVSSRMAAIIENGGFARVPVKACLARQMVTVRMLELPSTDPGEIADMVHLQMGKQTPYSEDEIVSDYRVLGSTRGGYSRVMLVIVQRGALRHYYHAIEGAGIEIDRLSISSEGILGWYGHVVGRESVEGADVVLDVDAACTEFAVMSEGALVFTRGIQIGAVSLAGDSRLKDRLAREVRQCLEACQSELAGIGIRRVLLTGAGGRLPGLAAYLKETLHVEVESRDALDEVVGEARPDDVEDLLRTVSLTAAVGAAAAPDALAINLVPDSVVLRRGLTDRAKGLTLLGILVMACLVSASVFATIRMGFKRGRLATVQADVNASHGEARRLEKMRAIVSLVQKRRDASASAVGLLNAIHEQLQGNVSLEEIVMELEREDSQVRLSGAALERSDVNALVRNLEASPAYQDVRVEGGMNQDRETGQYAFRIVCNLERAP